MTGGANLAAGQCGDFGSPFASRPCILSKGHVEDPENSFHTDGMGCSWSDDGVVTIHEKGEDES